MMTRWAFLIGSRHRRGRPWAPAARVLAGLMIAAGLFHPGSAAALPLPANDSGVTGYFDTTVSIGAAMRVSGRDELLFSRASGGNAYTFNSDDGNLNYDRGDLVSLNTKVNHELQLNLENPGAELSLFGRVLYFYDQVVADGDTERTALPAAAKRHAGRDFQLLDAYVAGDFDAGAVPVSVRLGNQVMSWGESVFLRGGINSINPADIAKLRVAGAELRDVLVPVPAANVKMGLGDSFSLEGFYQFRWNHTEVEAQGTFFSTSDIVGPGADTVHLGLGRGKTENSPAKGDDRDGARDPACAPGATSLGLCSRVPRAPDRDAGDQGQFGVALRYFAAALNDAELGLYYARIHSRLPLVSLHAGNPASLRCDPRDINCTGFAGSIRYFREFPEGIDLMGLSFNGELGASGFTIQGEVAYRRKQPLQIDNAELVFSAMSPLGRLGPPPPTVQGAARLLWQRRAQTGVWLRDSQTGEARAGDEVRGFKRKDVVQGTLAVSRALAPMLGADGWVVLAEAGFTQVRGMEDKSELRYDGTGTWTSGNPIFTARGIQPVTQETGFADPFSWGYRAVLRGAYSNALGPVNLAPQVAFAQDVNGTAPRPIGNFVEGRKTVTLSVEASYLLSWQAQLAYTNFFGAGQHNLLGDRDFVSFTVSYSF